MRRAAFSVAIVAVALGGCISNAAVAPVESAVVNAAPSWSAATRVFQVPAGDSYGALHIPFEPEDGAEILGRHQYGIFIDTSDLGEGSYSTLSAFGVDDGAAQWRVTSSGFRDRHAVGLSGDAGSGKTILFVVVFSTEQAGEVRATAWTKIDQTLPESEVVETWTAAGPSIVSYHWALHGIFTAGTGVDVRSHGVEVESTGLPPDGPVSAGAFRLHTTHPAGEPSVDFSHSFFAPEASVGIARVAWHDGQSEHSQRRLVASPGLISSHVGVGATHGETRTSVEVTHASALPWIIFEHSTSRLDLSTLGLRSEPKFLSGLSLPGGSARSSCWANDASVGCL